jgi:uncharacterized protein (DUF1800 family)
MPLSPLQQKLHLMHRAGFGPKLTDLNRLEQTSAQEHWRQMLAMAKNSPAVLLGQDENANPNPTETPKEKAERQRQGVLQLNQQFFEQMVDGPNQLLEKMSFFWHGHFACRVLHGKASAGLINTIRQGALGNFKALLLAVSQSPAMIKFLNNQQNKKSKPNENFARELMELFTLGRGNYTEKDIKESARAFTGWTLDPQGDFIINPKQHDDQAKTFFGQTGNFGGEQIIDMILAKKECAYFITQKIYQFFVNPKPDADRIKQLSDKFYQSNYDIAQLMDAIFGSQWFYDTKHVGQHIKSPIELMVGVLRLCPTEVLDYSAIIQSQKALGQMLFFPPNVAGWPQGQAWIDSNSIMLRLQWPSWVLVDKNIGLEAKADDDLYMGMAKESRKNKAFFAIKREPLAQDAPQNMSFEQLKKCLILVPNQLPNSCLPYFEQQTPLPFLQKLLCLMSYPEFQLS